MDEILHTKLVWNTASLQFVLPEVVLAVACLGVLLAGLWLKARDHFLFLAWVSSAVFLLVIFFDLTSGAGQGPVHLFGGMILTGRYTDALKTILDFAGLLTVLLSITSDEIGHSRKRGSEYFFLIFAAVLGAHLMVMSINLLMLFLSVEMLSISSYILVGFSPTARASEGSLKYFLYGTVASAVMLYGFTILYGLSGTADFSSSLFFEGLNAHQSPLLLVAGLFSLTGLLFKITAAPMHMWAPDVYQAAPLPVVAFLSVVPKVAGLGALAQFILGLNLFGQSVYNWQLVLAVVALATILVGNLSALWQRNLKRLMAYSSIAQSGFMLVGLVAFSMQGIQFFIFYACIYVIMNYLVFLYLQRFERQALFDVQDFAGRGSAHVTELSLLTIGLIALSGLPPTAGFMAKLFIFTGLWNAYEETGRHTLVILLIAGLLNTAISIFFYLKVPYFAFFKGGEVLAHRGTPRFLAENFMGIVLVLLLLLLFIQPGLLMRWLNSINFVL